MVLRMMALRDIEPLVPKLPAFSRLLVSGDNQKQTRRATSSPERARKGPLLFAPPGPTRRPPAFFDRPHWPRAWNRLQNSEYFLLGLSKGNARVEISASFFLFVRSATVCKSLTRMRGDLTLMSTWHCVMADEQKLMRWKISTNAVYNTLKTDKDEERFHNGLVRKPYERTFMSEPFIEKHARSTALSNVNREKHKLKSHRVSCSSSCMYAYYISKLVRAL